MATAINQTTESLLTEIITDCPEIFACKPGFVFQAFGASIFETAVDLNHYEYTAYNNHSGKSELIDRRRKPLQHTDKDELALLHKLCASKVSGMGRLEIDSGAVLRADKLREVMREVFREILPRYGYITREGQIELAEKLLNAITERGTLLAEAAVGIGKTLAYVIVAALVKRSHVNEHWNTGYFPELSVVEWKRMPVVISTASIALQRSIEKDVIPEVSMILLENGVIRNPLRAVLAKGRSHYVCEYNLKAHMPFEKNPEFAELLRQIAFDGRKIDLAEIEGLTAHIKKRICVPAKCLKNCPYADGCRFHELRDALRREETDIVICNHNLLLADAKLRAETGKSILPPYQMAVFDEAHEVLQAARSIYGLSLGCTVIPDITQSVLKLNFAPLLTEGTDDWRDNCDISHRLAEQLYGRNKKVFAKSDANTVCDRHMKLIRNISGELHYALKKTYTFKNKHDEERRNALICELESLNKRIAAMASSSRNIRWFEHDNTS